jgi:hypothetical protein
MMYAITLVRGGHSFGGQISVNEVTDSRGRTFARAYATVNDGQVNYLNVDGWRLASGLPPRRVGRWFSMPIGRYDMAAHRVRPFGTFTADATAVSETSVRGVWSVTAQGRVIVSGTWEHILGTAF